MKKKISIFFFIIIFFLLQNKIVHSQINNKIIISVGDHAITTVDLLKEIKLIAILSDSDINQKNRDYHINVSNIENGLYILNVIGTDNKFNRVKVIIKR